MELKDFITDWHLSPSSAWSLRFKLISWRSILILSSHLGLGFSRSLLPSGLPTETLYATFSRNMCSTCAVHRSLLGLIIQIFLSEVYEIFVFKFTLKISGQVFEKYTNAKFHGNGSGGSRVVQCGRTDRRTDMTKPIIVFLNFANGPKITWIIFKDPVRTAK